ncbi:uncharacterized protein Hyls1 [Fopius arisanus]|uniref:Uncharacterized protein Hyls1 n=1 Tax=Fopius arisanus TaxID=64838 RepID=A0A9R1U0S9_9HYME|nr:PREDICTED: uncharacterized protein LOC105266994 [Fopius arisanus]
MPEVKDDPRQVLTLLNSLGFVGITAEQLKTFMKDLKIYRKVKERERQQWKDGMKRKILQKQKTELAKLLMGPSSPEPPQAPADPIVEIQIECVSDSDTNDERDNAIVETKRENFHKIRALQKKETTVPTNSVNVGKTLRNHSNVNQEIKTHRGLRNVTPPRSASAPDLSEPAPRVSRSKSTSSEPTKMSSRNPSRCSSRSQSKSFIRPWRLNPETQGILQTVKSDPVALYQNYQKGWKQISFPGENPHTDIRWAVREKMLGIDPTPKPILKKSCSTMSVKRR